MKLLKRSAALFTAFCMLSASIGYLGINAFAESGLEASGWYNSAYAVWQNDSKAEAAKAEYRPSGETAYTAVDKELVRAEGSGGRVDIPGLAAGSYDIRVTTAGGEVLTAEGVKVADEDRSGYAHFNYTSGVGAYTNEGTPKSNADIIYVTNETKNTVEYGGYKGIGNILSKASAFKNPLIVRFIGMVDTRTRDADGTKTTDTKNGVVELKGLTDKDMGNDSYFNMCDVSRASNITIEGIGGDAEIQKWGFTFSKCTGIEVKNLRFSLYPEDACSTSSETKRVWIHRCTFDKGENLYDLTDEKDKGDGDGSTDINNSSNVTIAYCRYNNCHKTSLNGGSDSTKQYNYTYHHNYFNNCSARLPLTRYVNVHLYNNYTYKASSAISSRASAWVFSEENYYEDTDKVFETLTSSYGTGFIKSYNDVIVNSKYNKDKNIVIADKRDAQYTADNSVHPQSTRNFDTKPDVFYYDSEAKTTKVAHLTDAQTAKTEAVKNAGVLSAGQELIFFENIDNTSSEGGSEVEYKTIDADYELKADSFEGNPYFKAVGDFSETNKNRIRLWEENSLTFKVAKGACIEITASHASSTTSGTRTLNLLDSEKQIIGSQGYEMGEPAITVVFGKDLEEGEYTLQASSHINVTSVKITFPTVSDTTETSTEASTTTETTTTTTTETTTTTTTTETTTEATTATTTETTTETTTATTTGTTTEATTATTTETTTETTTATTTETTTETPVVAGDVDNNGVISANDAAVLLAYVIDSASANDNWKTELAVADVNNDKVTDSADAALILARVLDSSVKFKR